MMTEYLVRDAAESDLQTLWKLQMEMLDVQGYTDVRDIPISEFRDAVFGEHPATNFKVCEKRTDSSCKLIGFISYFFGVSYPSGKIIYIEDIFVNEENRKSGAGKLLLQAAVSVAMRRGCRKVMLHCANWNERAYGFYKHIGMNDEHSRILYFDREGIEKFCAK